MHVRPAHCNVAQRGRLEPAAACTHVGDDGIEPVVLGRVRHVRHGAVAGVAARSALEQLPPLLFLRREGGAKVGHTIDEC